MQRSKIKVGAEYGEARYRDWAEYASRVKRVQVLSVEPWRVVPHGQAESDETAPDAVAVPGTTDEALEVPRRYRRLVPTQWSRGLGTLVLVREWVENRDTGGGHWGKPQVAETRHIVATWPDAEKQIAEAQARRDADRRASEAERSRLREREGRINERMRDLGIQMNSRVERSRFNHDVDVLTIRADMLFTLLDLAEQGYAAQRETTYSLAEVRDGTGFEPDVRFAPRSGS
jgi:hypothetical protein